MFNLNKLLIPFSLIIIGVGIVLLWFGLMPGSAVKKTTISLSTAQSTPDSEESTVTTATPEIEGEKAYVTKVVDGDTIHVTMNGNEYTIRLLGVDTPETVDPRKPVQCFGKEASSEVKKLLTGKNVILQKDVSETDIYKRLLRFVYLPIDDGDYLFVNDYLIRQGFAKPLTIPPDVNYSEQFLEAGREARIEKRGLWGKC